MNTYKTIKCVKGETYNRTRTVNPDTNVVVNKQVTKHDKEGNLYLTWSFDFTDITREQLMDIATRALVIDARPAFKKCDIADIDSWDNKMFIVKDMITKTRSKKSDADKIKDLLKGKTPEEIAAILASIGA